MLSLCHHFSLLGNILRVAVCLFITSRPFGLLSHLCHPLGFMLIGIPRWPVLWISQRPEKRFCFLLIGSDLFIKNYSVDRRPSGSTFRCLSPLDASAKRPSFTPPCMSRCIPKFTPLEKRTQRCRVDSSEQCASYLSSTVSKKLKISGPKREQKTLIRERSEQGKDWNEFPNVTAPTPDLAQVGQASISFRTDGDFVKRSLLQQK